MRLLPSHRLVWLGLLVSASLFIFTGCEEGEDDMEEAGDTVEEAAEESGEATEEAFE